MTSPSARAVKSTATEEPPWQKLLGDPLKEITRKERRALLGVSVVAFLVARTGVLPRKIESIGVEFLSDNRPTVLLTLAAVVAYFLVVFAVYAASDLIVWQRSYFALQDLLKFEEAERQHLAEETGAKNIVIGTFAALPKWLRNWQATLYKSVLPMSMTRAAVEFVLPAGVGVFALVSVIRAAWRSLS